MENSLTSSRDPSVDSMLTDGLTGNTGMGINTRVPYSATMGVSNPGHLQLACAHVWGRRINARTNKALLASSMVNLLVIFSNSLSCKGKWGKHDNNEKVIFDRKTTRGDN